MYVYSKGFAPCRRPPRQQATGWLVDWWTGRLVDWFTGWLVDWLTAEKKSMRLKLEIPKCTWNLRFQNAPETWESKMHLKLGSPKCTMDHFLYPQLLFCRRWGSIFGTWDTILVILGSRGTPNGHLGVQIWILIDFGWIFGPSWDPLWGNFCDFFVIWDSKVAVQVPG